MDNYQSAKRLMENINQVFVGKEAVVENLLTAFLAGGHVLLEDVPGVGKTTLALLFARSMSCSIRKNSVYAGYAAGRCGRGFRL